MTTMAEQRAGQPPHGAVAQVLIHEYDDDRIRNLPRLRKEVDALVAVLREHGWVDDGHDLIGRGTSRAVRDALGRWQPAARRLLLIWAGHGRAQRRGGLRLYCRDTVAPTPANSLSADDLGALLASKAVDEVVLIVDACQAGGGTVEAVRAFEDELAGTRYPDGGRPSLAVISSASSGERAQEEVFARALTQVLRDGPPDDPNETWWTEHDRFIFPSELVKALRVTLAREAVRQRPDHHMAGMVTRFFPNPRYRAFSPDVEVEAKRRRGAWLAADVHEHFMLKFRGIDATDERGWYFTGRHEPLREIVGWLGTARSGLLVVTGPPGCGKSAVLGRLAVLSDERYRQEAEAAGALRDLTPDVDPGVGAITAGVHVKNKTLLDCVGELAEALDLPAPDGGWESAGQLVAAVGGRARAQGRGQVTTLLFDALDEARPVDLQAITRELLRGLAALSSVRVIVGTRPDRAGGAPSRPARDGGADGPLLRALGRDRRTIDLAEDPDSQDAIRRYVTERLVHTDGSPYQTKPWSAEGAARAVAERSAGVFLLGRLLSRALVRRDEVLDLESPWRRLVLAGSVGRAFAADLARFGDDKPRVRELLTPLAWAEGAGLPRRDVWLAISNALAESGPYDDSDLAWLLNHAGAHLVESGEDGQTVYRLYHQMFDDYLRSDGRPEGRRERVVQRRITEALLALAGAEGARDWANANPYLHRHLATHAAAAGKLDRVVGDVGYLMFADSRRLARVLGGIGHEDPLVRAYWRALPRLHDATPEQRAQKLHEVALLEEPGALPALRSQAELAWRGIWTTRRAAPFHRRLVGHTAPVDAVAIGEVAGRSAIVSGGQDGTVRLWDGATGETLLVLDAGTRWVRAVAIADLGDRQLVVAGGDGGGVRLWDAESGELVHTISTGRWVESVVVTRLDGRTVLVTGGEGGLLQLWDAASGDRLAGNHLPEEWGWVESLAATEEGGRTSVYAAQESGAIYAWSPAGATSTSWALDGPSHPQRLSVVGVGDRAAVVSQSMTEARGWDVETGEPMQLVGVTLPSLRSEALGVVDGHEVTVAGHADGVVEIRYLDDDQGPTPAANAEPEPTGSALVRVTDQTAPDLPPDRHVRDVALAKAPGGLFVVAAGRDTVRRWHVAGNGEADASGDHSPLSVEEGEVAGRDIRFVALSPSRGRQTIVALGGQGRLRRWDVGTLQPLPEGTPIETFPAPGGPIQSQSLAAGSDVVKAWDVDTGAATEPRLGDATAFAAGEVAGRAVLATAFDTTILLRDAATGQPLSAIPPGTGQVTSLAVSTVADTTLILAGGHDGQVRSWEPLSGRQRRWRRGWLRHTLSHTGAVRSVTACAVDGRTVVVSGGDDGTVRLWDLDTGRRLRVLDAGAGPVLSVAAATVDGGALLVTGADDGSVRLWDPSTGEELAHVPTGAGSVDALAVCERDGGAVVAVGTGREIDLVELRRRPEPDLSTPARPAAEPSTAPFPDRDRRSVGARLVEWLSLLLRTAAWLAVLSLHAGLVFVVADDADAMAPVPGAAHDVRWCDDGQTPPCFQAAGYGLDVTVPFVDLGIDESWQPVETVEHGRLWVHARTAFMVAGWAVLAVPVVVAARRTLTALMRRPRKGTTHAR